MTVLVVDISNTEMNDNNHLRGIDFTTITPTDLS